MYGLGRFPAPDARDSKFPMSLAIGEVPSVLPTCKYWPHSPVLNQGNQPHCVGYSWYQWLRSEPLPSRNGPAPDVIYYEAQKIDEWPGQEYAGTSVRAGIKYLASKGHVASYLWAQKIDDIINFVLLKGTVVIGTNWYSSMFTPDLHGYIHPTGNLVGGHAYMIFGYDRKKRSFRCLNSWGKNWGYQGRFWMMEEDVARLIFSEYGEACTAIEQKISPII